MCTNGTYIAGDIKRREFLLPLLLLYGGGETSSRTRGGGTSSRTRRTRRRKKKEKKKKDEEKAGGGGEGRTKTMNKAKIYADHIGNAVAAFSARGRVGVWGWGAGGA